MEKFEELLSYLVPFKGAHHWTFDSDKPMTKVILPWRYGCHLYLLAICQPGSQIVEPTVTINAQHSQAFWTGACFEKGGYKNTGKKQKGKPSVESKLWNPNRGIQLMTPWYPHQEFIFGKSQRTCERFCFILTLHENRTFPQLAQRLMGRTSGKLFEGQSISN